MVSGSGYSSEGVVGVTFQDEESEIGDFSSVSDDDVDELSETAESYQSDECGSLDMRRSQTRIDNSGKCMRVSILLLPAGW